MVERCREPPRGYQSTHFPGLAPHTPQAGPEEPHSLVSVPSPAHPSRLLSPIEQMCKLRLRGVVEGVRCRQTAGRPGLNSPGSVGGILNTHLPKGPLVSSVGRRPGPSCCPWKGPASERSGSVRFRGGVMTTPCRARRVSRFWELGVLVNSNAGTV